jgi:hypothetical protein
MRSHAGEFWRDVLAGVSILLATLGWLMFAPNDCQPSGPVTVSRRRCCAPCPPCPGGPVLDAGRSVPDAGLVGEVDDGNEDF